MKKFIRFDSVGGASGDMILAALASIGADLKAIETQLNTFMPEKITISQEPAAGSGLHGVRVRVRLDSHAHDHHHDHTHWPDAHHDHSDEHDHHHEHSHAHNHEHDHNHKHGHGHSHSHDHHHRGLNEIVELIKNSSLSPSVRTMATQVFEALAIAEAKIHNKTPESVHFHEVGAWDSIADIIGCCIALEQLDVDGVSCGPLPSGVGTLQCAHGEMPNPAPATMELLSGMPVIQTSESAELVTPTGAALLRIWTSQTTPVPENVLPQRSGFGFGSWQLKGRPNVLRATLMHGTSTTAESLLILESNLDDSTPELIAGLTQELLDAGALDVWQTPVTMKKGRSATIITALIKPHDQERMEEMIFRGTTTFGIRSYPVNRRTLERRIDTVATPWGEVTVKQGLLNGELITTTPEYDSCAAIAAAANQTTRKVWQHATSNSPTH